MFYLRLASALLGFLAASVYGVAIAVLRRDRRMVARDYARMLGRLIRPALGIRTRVIGREHLSAVRPCIYVVNHQSVYDVPALADLYPSDTVVIGKKELRSIPIFGWLYTVTGNVLIDRTNNPSAVGRLREAEEAVLTRRVSVWIFPEGTRATTPGRLLPFKRGAFHMAVATGAPLVPIVMQPIQGIFDLKRRRIVPATVEIRVLEPIPTAGLTEGDVTALLRTTQARMQDELTAMTARAGRTADDGEVRAPAGEAARL